MKGKKDNHYRRFSFGRRKSDNLKGDGRPSTSLMSIPQEEHEAIIGDIRFMLHAMPGAKEYLEEVLAQAQASGFSFDKEPVIR